MSNPDFNPDAFDCLNFLKSYEIEARYELAVKAYLGLDPSTGKKLYPTRRGFKTQKAAKKWLERYKTQVKESSYIRVTAIFKSNILPNLSKKKITKISIPYCQTLVNKWYEKYETYKTIRSYTVAILDYAIELRYISDNPMKHVPVPKKKKKISD